MPGGQLITKGETELDACLAAFAAAPRAGALLCDIDGTISAIVARPGDAAVSQPFREVLAALTERLGLVAFVTGRALEDGRRMIPLDGAAYVGTHGLELMAPDGQILTEPQAERYIDEVQEVAAAAARDLDCDALGVVLENKRTVLAVHYRLAADAARTRHEILTRWWSLLAAGGWPSPPATSSSRCGRRCRSPRARPRAACWPAETTLRGCSAATT